MPTGHNVEPGAAAGTRLDGANTAKCQDDLTANDIACIYRTARSSAHCSRCADTLSELNQSKQQFASLIARPTDAGRSRRNGAPCDALPPRHDLGLARPAGMTLSHPR